MTILASDVAFVTGASSGIGAAVVRSLRQRDVTVHAVARRAERLDSLARETGCMPHELDVRDREALMALASRLDVDILVNNAGIGRAFASLAEADPEDVAATLETNVTAATHAVQAVLPGMIERRRGHVVNLGSMAGLYALSSVVYGASKGAIHLMSLNLRLELQGTGVRVTEICPGRVDTEFYTTNVEPELADRLLDTSTTNLAPEDVAAAIVYALDAPDHVNVNRIELQPTEQTYGGSQFVPVSPR